MGVLCVSPPPNQKGQEKELSLCAEAPERRQQLQSALRAAGMDANQLDPSQEQQKLQGVEGSAWLSHSVVTRCCSAHQGSSSEAADGAALPVCLICTFFHFCNGKKLVNECSILCASRQLCYGCPDLPVGGGQEGQAEMPVVVLSMSCLSDLQSPQAWWKRRIFFSDISVLCQGAKAVPHFAFLEKGLLEKCCKCIKRSCQQVFPCSAH